MVAVYRDGYLGSSTETVGKSSFTTYRLREILSCAHLNNRSLGEELMVASPMWDALVRVVL